MTQYVRQEKIGQGAWSTVYKGLDRMSGQVVAMKQLVLEAGLPRREVALARQITHPNVCRIYNVFEAEDGSYCIVMEFVDGGNLRAFIEKSKAPSLEKILSIAGQILDGLEAAHRQNVMHLDLKPENILLTSNGTVKITDFGLAREIGKEQSRKSGWPGGTPGYWAPEQARGEKCDERADIYAFGFILREMLSASEAPAHVAAVIEKCWETNRDRRFGSVAEVRKALNRYTVRRLTGLLAVAAVILLFAVIPFWRESWSHGFNELNGLKSVGSPASETFADGMYFLRKDMAADALNRFDATLAIDPRYAGAHHYRGLALAKLNRLDEAIDAFKRALPRSEPEQLLLWNWAPSLAPEHGIIRGMDTTQLHVQRYLFEKGKGETLPKRVVYGERTNGITVLYFLDLEGHVAHRREIRDPHIVLDGTAPANESFVVLPSSQGLYGFARDGTELWHKQFSDHRLDTRKIGLSGNTLFLYFTDSMRIDLLDARTGDLLWKRENMPFDGIEAPMVRHTKAFGDIFIIKSQNTYHAMRKSDGSDAWSVPVKSEKVSELVNNAGDSSLIVFEPERRIFTVDLETGKTSSEVKLEQYVDALPTPFGPKWLVGAIVEGNTLYVISKDLELNAISIHPELRVVWKTPINAKMQSIRVHRERLYLGTDTGELIVMDAANGKITNTTKLSEQPVVTDYAGDDAVVIGSDKTVYGLSVDGLKNWESPSVDTRMETTYFNGIITVYNSPAQMSALDVATGKRLWQVDGTRPPFVYTNAGRFFVLEEHGAKEYAIRKPAESITDKETLTELAKAYQGKGDLDQARVFVDKASEIDPNYPPVRLIRSQVLKAQGNRNEAGRELARYASLVGVDSPAGQHTVSELNRDYGLVWQTSIGPFVAGDPVLVENRVISVGRRIAREAPIIALDAQTGAAVWRYAGEGYVASVMAEHVLWYVTGSQADPTLVTLYRIDTITGERKQIASWHRPSRVDQAWIAYAPGKVFAATESVDVDKSTMQLAVDCFDAGSGARLSQQSDIRKANMSERERPVGLLASIGFPSIDSPLPAKSPPAALWNTSSFLSEKNRFYAFTDDGHAYAMRLN